MSNTSTTNDDLLKDYYSGHTVEDMVDQDNPTLAIIPRNEMAVGRQHDHCIVTGAGQSRSATEAKAFAMAALTSTQMSQFQVPLVANHCVANISAQLIAQTKGEKGSFLNAVTLIVDSELKEFANDASLSLFRGKDGARGRIDATTNLSSSVLVLKNADDANNFRVGMQLDLCATQTGSTVKAYGSNSHGLYIIKVDTNNGTLTVGTLPNDSGTAVAINDSADGIPSAASQDFIYVAGDYDLKPSGFESWIPYGGPSGSDSFFGINRSRNTSYLAGHWLEGTTGSNIKSVLETASGRVARSGGKLSHFVMGHEKFSELSQELGQNVRITDVKSASGRIGFTGIEVVGHSGKIVCIPDRSCPADRIWGINKDSWELVSVGKIAKVWDEDGQKWLRQGSSFGMELRYFNYMNVVCYEPRNNINIKVNA
jgi:hypothetical protein